jgi:hypothetical protein
VNCQVTGGSPHDERSGADQGLVATASTATTPITDWLARGARESITARSR